MTWAERALTLLLRLEAALVFCALPAIVMPTSWMDAVHQSLGMGELPRGPIVEYLTRSLSMLYVSYSPLLWVMASEVRRYLPLIWVFNVLSLCGGVTFLVLDILIEMPVVWIILEASTVFGFAVMCLLLTWKVHRESRDA